MTPRATTTPRHIIVHGGNDGEFYYEGKASNGRPDSAYFGEGMTRFTFWFDTPRVLVLPSTVEEIKLAADMADDLKAGTDDLRRRTQGLEGVDAHRNSDEERRLQHRQPLRVHPPAGRGVG